MLFACNRKYSENVKFGRRAILGTSPGTWSDEGAFDPVLVTLAASRAEKRHICRFLKINEYQQARVT